MADAAVDAYAKLQRLTNSMLVALEKVVEAQVLLHADVKRSTPPRRREAEYSSTPT